MYYTKSVGGGKYCSAEFITNGDKSWTITIIQTVDEGTFKRTYKLSDKEPAKKYNDDDNGGGNESVGNKPKNILKKGVGKVTGLFKKKK